MCPRYLLVLCVLDGEPPRNLVVPLDDFLLMIEREPCEDPITSVLFLNSTQTMHEVHANATEVENCVEVCVWTKEKKWARSLSAQCQKINGVRLCLREVPWY